MKHVILAALLVAAPLAAQAQTPAGRSVRELVANTDVTNWQYGGGWTWADGVLTHYPGATGAVAQTLTTSTEAGRNYRVKMTFAGRTRGSVSVKFGGETYQGYGTDGTFYFLPAPAGPTTPLAFEATQDFDGSIKDVTVVELGPELVDAANWTVPEGWTATNGTFADETGSPVSLERAVAVEPGHVYRVYFGTNAPPTDNASAGTGSLIVGAGKDGWFHETGGWNYSFDVTADANGRIAFKPSGAGTFTGSIRSVSVREVTTDVVEPPAQAPTPVGATN